MQNQDFCGPLKTNIEIKFSLSSSKKYTEMGQTGSTQLYFAAHEIKGLQNNAIKLN